MNPVYTEAGRHDEEESGLDYLIGSMGNPIGKEFLVPLVFEIYIPVCHLLTSPWQLG